MAERWRWVDGYEGLYMVSDQGRVMSTPQVQMRGNHAYSKPGMELKPQDNGRGYKVVGLYRDGRGRLTTVHRLVASAFIDNPDNKPDINHIDGDKSNNTASNLEWVTKSENMQHASKVLNALDFNRVFSDEEVLAIRSDTRTDKEVAEERGVSQGAISNIRSGKTYANVGGVKRLRHRERQRKLTPEQVASIRASNKTGKELAAMYSVAASTISKIKSNQRYKEIGNVSE